MVLGEKKIIEIGRKNEKKVKVSYRIVSGKIVSKVISNACYIPCLGILIQRRFYEDVKEYGHLESIIAHEMGHKLYFRRLSFVALIIALAVSLKLNLGIVLALGLCLSSLLLMVCTSTIVLNYWIEYKCDEYAAKLVGVNPVIGALLFSEKRVGKSGLFHPSIRKRIKRLMELKKKQIVSCCNRFN